MVTPDVSPLLFEILTMLRFGELRRNHVVSTAVETIAKTMTPASNPNSKVKSEMSIT